MIVEWLRPDRAWRLRHRRSPLIYVVMMVVGLGAAALITITR